MSYTDYKISIFTGINDVPVAPTVSLAGNGSHLIAQLNGICDDLAIDIPLINTTIAGLPTTDWSTAINGLTTDLNSAIDRIDTLETTVSGLSGGGGGAEWPNNFTWNYFDGLAELSVSYSEFYLINGDSSLRLAYSGLKFNNVEFYSSSGTSRLSFDDLRIITNRQPAINDLLTTATLLETTNKVNSILEMLRTHGLIYS